LVIGIVIFLKRRQFYKRRDQPGDQHFQGKQESRHATGDMVCTTVSDLKARYDNQQLFGDNIQHSQQSKANFQSIPMSVQVEKISSTDRNEAQIMMLKINR